MSEPAHLWDIAKTGELSGETVRSILSSIEDDYWVLTACVDTVVDDSDAQQCLVDIGLERSLPTVTHCKALLDSSSEEFSLSNHLESSPVDAKTCLLRSILLSRSDRLAVYRKMVEALMDEEDTLSIDDDGWEDDPWGTSSSQTSTSRALPFRLSECLVGGLFEQALTLASTSLLKPLQVLLRHYAGVLWPYRFTILNAIPAVTDPSHFGFILPSLDLQCSAELRVESIPIRETHDWVELPSTQQILSSIIPVDTFPIPPVTLSSSVTPAHTPLISSDLQQWYRDRVSLILQHTGLVDVALAIAQHGASVGIPTLDSLEEDLSLFSRVVYERTPDAPSTSQDLSWEEWQTLEPNMVIKEYLKASSPTTLPDDLKRLVLPYLFILELKAERSGHPDPTLHRRLLYDYILTSSMENLVSIFEVSKPTLSPSERIIPDDEDLARLALSCLYGCHTSGHWDKMYRIFECLPAWDSAEEDQDLLISAAAASFPPSPSHPTPSTLMTHFTTLSQSSLSYFLDILDMHLEAAEIFSRWQTPVPLGWFLLNNDQLSAQRSWATKMTRRNQASPSLSKDEWEMLLDDMLKLGSTLDNGLRGALGLLSKEEVVRIFFSGLLITGSFEVARHLLQHSPNLQLSSDVVEELCLTCSQELYDNAPSGNFNFGDMKLAYDCLLVAPPTKAIENEKHFIEATSRISSLNIYSRPGILISPIEIRLTKDRLSLVSRVLAGNADAYKHSGVILDLVDKLGFRDDVVARAKTFAMLCETALQTEDFKVASQHCVALMDTIKLRRQSHPTDDPVLQEVQAVGWTCCYQLGRHPEFVDVEMKLLTLGFTLEICPADRLHEVLTTWRKVEDEYLDTAPSQEAFPNRASDHRQSKHLLSISENLSLRSRLQHFHMPSPPLLNTPDAAALATKTFKSMASNFPFRAGSSHSHSIDGESFRSDDVSVQASRALSKGIGWLIGADQEE